MLRGMNIKSARVRERHETFIDAAYYFMYSGISYEIIIRDGKGKSKR